jgi:hypothetical protein
MNFLNDRRWLMKASAGLALVNLLMSQQSQSAQPPQSQKKGNGKPGDFNFLTGEWKIQNRRLKAPDSQDWDEFEGEATVWGFLEGIGSLEELRIPARKFSGMGLRLLDIDQGIWNDYWVNSKAPVLSVPGLQGQFEKGVGTFSASEEADGSTLIVRGVWDQIEKDSCRWYQTASKDNGKTWQDNWVMRWSRKK